MRKVTITCGVFEDQITWWHYYFGNKSGNLVTSGNYRTKQQAMACMEALIEQTKEQFGNDTNVDVERLDNPNQN